MKKSALLFFSLCFAAQALFAQQKPVAPEIKPDAPEWAKMLAADNPNAHEVEQAYRAYYNTHPFEKNTYTQFFKRWMHWARPFVQADGSVRVPSAEEQAAAEAQLQKERGLLSGQTQAESSSAGAWTFAGPNKHFSSNGSLTAVSEHTNIYNFDIAPSNANILYAGGETGGLWKTTDKGLNWTLLTKNIAHGSFGAVKIHPTNPDIVWAATGGKIIKTINGGTTWTTVFTLNNLWVNELAVSSSNPDVVLAAADQGLIRTANGGTTWTTLFTNTTWAVKQKVGAGATFFLARKNGTSSQFMKSTDSGATWTATGTGWYAPASGQTISGVMLAPCTVNTSKLYAYMAGDGGTLGGYVGVFVSTNDGANWSNTHPTSAVGQPYSIPNHVNLLDADGVNWFYQGFYDMGIAVNPANDNELIAGGCSWWKSTNGGATWTAFGGYVGSMPGYRHPDVQAINWVGSDLWVASDGGLDYSNNGGATIESRNNGISGADLWGFDNGWNDDIMVGGRYHNGNMAYYSGYPAGQFLSLGGGEAATGYVNPGPGRKTYHSDIGGKALPATLSGTPQNFNVSTWPNESYAYYANSEMVWHPNCWSIVFLGKEQKLWKSTDGGSSFSVVYTFPGDETNTVFDIEICRANPQVLYVSQWDGTDDAIFRSADGGATFTQCTALPLPNNNDRVKMAVSDTDPNTLWVAVTYGSNLKKIYKTTNGGSTWTNLTTATLNGKEVQNIMAQYGTNGGVYIGTSGGTFYRNNSHNDWQAFSDGLPLSIQTNRLKPFYKTGKIRLGAWGFGVWESPLFEASTPKANAMVNKLYSGCQRDTFFFDDYSAVNHTGATWAWQFPGAAWASSLTARNPKATYPAPGTYSAIMSLTFAGQTTHDTLSISIGTECSADSIPGKALHLGGNASEDCLLIPPLNINTNTFSFSAWIKPDGIQPEYSPVFMHDGDAGGLHFQPGNNHLGYHWPNGAWWWDSGLEVPSGQWSHVALVVTPTAVTIYLNGVPSTHSGLTLPKINFTSTSRLGNYQGWGGRYYKGDIEEACIYNRALTQNEIREKMHLRRVPTSETKLEAYYQFNEVSGGTVYDRSKTRHGSLVNAASRIASTVAVGPGGAFRKTVTLGGVANFGTKTNFVVTWPTTGTFPNGEVVVTRINLAPDQAPTADPLSRAYWVVRNYGTNQNFTLPTKVAFSKIGNVPSSTTASQYKLYKRAANGEGATWAFQDAADLRTAGADGGVTFSTGNGITSFGSQFVITKPVASPEPAFETSDRSPALAENAGENRQFSVQVGPNPLARGAFLKIYSDLSGEATFRLFDEKGRAVRIERFTGGSASISTAGLAAGAYFYRVENEVFMSNGKVVVE